MWHWNVNSEVVEVASCRIVLALVATKVLWGNTRYSSWGGDARKMFFFKQKYIFFSVLLKRNHGFLKMSASKEPRRWCKDGERYVRCRGERGCNMRKLLLLPSSWCVRGNTKSPPRLPSTRRLNTRGAAVTPLSGKFGSLDSNVQFSSEELAGVCLWWGNS